jgi:hypothetical protein
LASKIKYEICCMIQVHPMLRKSGGMYIIQQRNYLPQFYYLHTKWTSHYKSFIFSYDHFLHTALQQLAWFQCTITIYSRKNNIYKQQIFLQGHANKRN